MKYERYIFGTVVVPIAMTIPWADEPLEWEWQMAAKSLKGVNAFVQHVSIRREVNEVELRYLVEKEEEDKEFLAWLAPWVTAFNSVGDSHAGHKVR